MKIRRFLLGLCAVVVLAFTAGIFAPATVYAAPTCNSSEQPMTIEGKTVCCPKGTATTSNSTTEADASACMFRKYINPAIYLLSVIAGIAVVGGLIYGGILYASSAGQAQKVTKAKSTITKALTALVMLMLLAPFIRFMSPGGVNSITRSPATAAACSDANKFLGLKPWFAYLPDDSFDTDCSIKNTVIFWPTQDPNNNDKLVPGVLPQVVLAVVDGMLRIAALVAVVFVIAGGIQYMTSQGEPAKVKESLSAIINALIGLAIAVVAAAVVSFIGNSLTS